MKLIDCDVHPLIGGAGEALHDYLSREMVERLSSRTLALETPLPPSRFPHPSGTLRPDATPPSGGAPGSDPEHMRTDLIEREEADAVVLLPIQAASVNWWANPTEAIGLASAFNDYFLDQWVGFDSRYHLSIVVAPQDPAAAAAEIRRLASAEGVAAVWVPVINTLLGDRHYHPIYDAALECGLPILLHPNGSEGMYQGTPSFAGGIPSTFAERFCDFPQIAQGNISSLVFEGVLEKFKGLRFIFSEWGWSWLPQLLWRMDTTWKATRIEVPWVRRAPSEYVREAIRFTTQPVDEPANQHDTIALIASLMHGEDVLMFSSDYPHWDGDDATRIVRVMPEAMRDAVFAGNALRTFRLGAPAAV
jgi:predicted TIM-barrel fold metal-dependent hydrolase